MARVEGSPGETQGGKGTSLTSKLRRNVVIVLLLITAIVLVNFLVLTWLSPKALSRGVLSAVILTNVLLVVAVLVAVLILVRLEAGESRGEIESQLRELDRRVDGLEQDVSGRLVERSELDKLDRRLQDLGVKFGVERSELEKLDRRQHDLEVKFGVERSELDERLAGLKRRGWVPLRKASQ